MFFLGGRGAEGGELSVTVGSSQAFNTRHSKNMHLIGYRDTPSTGK